MITTRPAGRARISTTSARAIAYWAATAILVTECIVGGVMGALRLHPFIDTATHLGYPAYFMTILGGWYIAAGVVVLAPRLSRAKEWAYAGLIFNYTGAIASHIWSGDAPSTLAGALVFVALTATSWALRPQTRRDFTPTPLVTGFPLARVVGYLVATVLVAAELAVGGVWDVLRTDNVRGVIEHLGYPTYLLTILGIWKVAGSVALVVPGFPRVKEWAYAGAVITYVCAIASHLSVGDGIDRIAAPMVLLALAVISWALYPPKAVRGTT